MKQGLEDLVKNLTKHLEELRVQMKEQKKTNANLEKEKGFLLRKVEQLEADMGQLGALQGDAEEFARQLRGMYVCEQLLRKDYWRLVVYRDGRIPGKDEIQGVEPQNILGDPSKYGKRSRWLKVIRCRD